MSALPPNLVGSILQSNVSQRQVSNIRNREETQRATADRQQTAAVDETDSTVETTDDDTQVHADAEGTGSQGRPFTQEEEEEKKDNQPEESADGQAGTHIDLEA